MAQSPEIQVARYQTKEHGIPKAPHPAYAVLKDGRPVINLTADELDRIVAEYFRNMDVGEYLGEKG